MTIIIITTIRHPDWIMIWKLKKHVQNLAFPLFEWCIYMILLLYLAVLENILKLFTSLWSYPLPCRQWYWVFSFSQNCDKEKCVVEFNINNDNDNNNSVVLS